MPHLKHFFHKLHSPWIVFLIILSGAVFGMMFPKLANSLSGLVHFYEMMLVTTVMPFVMSSILLSVERLSREHGVGKRTAQVFVSVFAWVFISAFVGAFLAWFADLGVFISRDALVTLFSFIPNQDITYHETSVALYAANDTSGQDFYLLKTILDFIIPANIFSSLSDGNYVKILVFCIALALGVSRVAHTKSIRFLSIVQAIFESSKAMIVGLTFFVPIIAFCAIASMVSSFGVSVIEQFVDLIIMFVAGGLTYCFLLLLFLSYQLKSTPWRVSLSFREAVLQLIATQSIAATIPNIISTLASHRVSERSLNTLIPFTAVLLRTGAAFYFGLVVVFVANLYHAEITLAEFFLICIGASVAAMASTGATGSVTVTFGALACTFAGLPFEALMLFLIAIDEICVVIRGLIDLLTGSIVSVGFSSVEDDVAEAVLISEIDGMR